MTPFSWSAGVPSGSAVDVDAAASAARRAFNEGPCRASTRPSAPPWSGAWAAASAVRTLRRYQEGLLRQPVAGTPLGVVGATAPWNAPLFVAALKLGPALVIGCTLVLKPSPDAPLHTYLLAEAAQEAGLPPGVLDIVAAQAEASEHPVRHVGAVWTTDVERGEAICLHLGSPFGGFK